MKKCLKGHEYTENSQKRCPVCFDVWKLANRDRIKARAKAYREANSEFIHAQIKNWKMSNSEHVKAQNKDYRKANKETLRDKAKINYEAKREQYLANGKKDYQKNKLKISLKNKAKKRRAKEISNRNDALKALGLENGL